MAACGQVSNIKVTRLTEEKLKKRDFLFMKGG